MSFLSTLPRKILATVAIVVGILFIVISDPPYSACDAQLESFKQAQTGFVILDKKSKVIKRSGFVQQLELCKQTNDPGGCYELFHKLRLLIRDFKEVPRECRSKVGKLKPVRQAISESLLLMVRLAWGDKPPTSYHSKFGWFDTSDIYLYCSLKDFAIQFYGQNWWRAFINEQLTSLPGSESLDPQKESWPKSIMSVNCARY